MTFKVVRNKKKDRKRERGKEEKNELCFSCGNT